ncbi:MAG: 3-phosphoshikimate 1-carboxyvinyltransferase [Paludibacteraceae bacterium]|nr:3-phosphoshikimate 1-carboxyvinyltransferase [Paludibacteraceae bacterium]
MSETRKYVTFGSAPHGVRLLPASKSLSNRALVINRLAGGQLSDIRNLAVCDDTAAVADAFANAGGEINIGAAGTAMRFLTAYYAIRPSGENESVLLTGSERMKHRPIGVLADALKTLDAQVEYAENEGFPPLRITPQPLQGGSLTIDGSISSQYISALLMIAPCMQQGLRLQLTGKIASKPYIDMTLALMNRYGAKAAWNGTTIEVAHGGYRPRVFEVESDWSAASYWYQLLALCSDETAWIELHGLQKDSLQGDHCVADWFVPLGVTTEYTASGVVLRKTKCSAAQLALDFTLAPDLAQTFVVTCCLMGIPFEFTGLESLKIKETDRIAALRCECAKLGFVLQEPCHGSLTFDGKRGPMAPCVVIDTYKDHRMAMAFAPVAVTDGWVTIADPAVVSKSYPDFWNEFERTDD